MIFALRVWRCYLYDICPDVAKRVKYKTKEMDKTHQRWIKLIKDYYCTIEYHNRKNKATMNNPLI